MRVNSRMAEDVYANSQAAKDAAKAKLRNKASDVKSKNEEKAPKKKEVVAKPKKTKPKKTKPKQVKKIIPNGLTQFFYGENSLYALNQKNADRKAQKKGYL